MTDGGQLNVGEAIDAETIVLGGGTTLDGDMVADRHDRDGGDRGAGDCAIDRRADADGPHGRNAVPSNRKR